MMRHFGSEEWVDFVNELMSQERMGLMSAHLAGGCKSCEGQLDMWRKVQKFAAAESAYQPPEPAVRAAATLFSTANQRHDSQEKRSFVQLLFDSLLEPAVAGARTADTSARQMLFRADAYQIDLQIEAKTGNHLILITGQVLDVSRPEVQGSGFHVVLRNRQGYSLHTAANKFGEFQLEIQNSRDLELTLAGNDGQSIVIWLGDPLEDAPEDRTGRGLGTRN